MLKKEICYDILKKDILNGKIISNIYGKDEIVFLDSEGLVLAIYQTYDKDNACG